MTIYRCNKLASNRIKQNTSVEMVTKKKQTLFAGTGFTFPPTAGGYFSTEFLLPATAGSNFSTEFLLPATGGNPVLIKLFT
jgi:hypothetical protein